MIDKEHLILSLQSEKDILESKLTSLITSNNQQLTSYYDLESKYKSLETLYNQTKFEFTMKLEEKDRMVASKLNSYEAEIDQLNEKLTQQNNAEETLIEYKKRASAAIKKSNQSLTELNIENQKLKQQMEELSDRVEALSQERYSSEEAVRRLESELAAMSVTLSEAKRMSETMKNTSAAVTGATGVTAASGGKDEEELQQQRVRLEEVSE